MTLSMGKYHCSIASVRYLSHNVVKAGCSFVCHEKKMMLWTGSDASVVDAVGEFEAQRFSCRRAVAYKCLF